MRNNTKESLRTGARLRSQGPSKSKKRKSTSAVVKSSAFTSSDSSRRCSQKSSATSRSGNSDRFTVSYPGKSFGHILGIGKRCISGGVATCHVEVREGGILVHVNSTRQVKGDRGGGEGHFICDLFLQGRIGHVGAAGNGAMMNRQFLR